MNDILSELNTGRNISLSGLSLSALSYLTSKLSPSFDSILVINPTDEAVGEFISSLECFTENVSKFSRFDVLPYIGLDPDPDIISSRISFLYQALQNPPKIVATSMEAIFRYLPPPNFIRRMVLELKQNEQTDFMSLVKRFAEMGYELTPVVEDIGTFSKRGGIIDAWSSGASFPRRIEFDGNRIVSIRKFDPSTQKSFDEIETSLFLPANEVSLDKETRNMARKRLQEICNYAKPPLRRQVLNNLEEGINFRGINSMLCLFHENLSSIMQYLPSKTLVVFANKDIIEARWEKLLDEMEKAFEMCQGFEKIIKPEFIFIKEEAFRKSCSYILDSSDLPKPDSIRANSQTVPDFKKTVAGDRWNEFIDFVKKYRLNGYKIKLYVRNESQKQRIQDALRIKQADLSFLEILTGRLSGGFILEDEKEVVISDSNLIDVADYVMPPKISQEIATATLSEFSEGDLIVHDKHGIGRFLGLVHLTTGKISGDYVLIEYRGGDRLYVPIDRLSLIDKYSSPNDDMPALDKLGNDRWEKAKSRAKKAANEIARELVNLYATRSHVNGISFNPPDESYTEFCAGFPFDETKDQEVAINQVMSDMDKNQPMDRLICGDVGFGKTEVALRAAFRAVMSSRQVAVLVPTTVLALQHFETFKKRFSDFPVKIEMLSRFITDSTSKKISKELQNGNVDIVVGTHKLLQSSVSFKNLGLLIVDEEHRFGVKHKERIKEIKHNVDAITMTATPIPRTLYMSLIGIRDASIITTAPSERQIISTYVSEFDDNLIRRAILSEIERGGQVFFVHNRVETIYTIHEHLKNILPDVKITVAHGQMHEKDLEKAMIDFLENKTNVLLCTAIIESGLDISNANTIIIDRADRFGLAQLYQLRGRVGRSNRHAYAYMLLPKSGIIATNARKRLSALVRYTALGSGFQIAMHDLELRGAGNILGTAQSGHIQAIGYELYTKILANAIAEQRGEKIKENVDTELNLGVEAYFPKDYIFDSQNRVVLYKKLANTENEEELSELMNEIKDRFGNFPKHALTLFDVIRIKIIAKKLMCSKITADDYMLSLSFDEKIDIPLERLMFLAKNKPENYKLTPKAFLIFGEFTGDNKLSKIKTALYNLYESSR